MTNTDQTMRAGGAAIGGQIGCNQQPPNRLLIGVDGDNHFLLDSDASHPFFRSAWNSSRSRGARLEAGGPGRWSQMRFVMCILTQRELEFLASLRKSWPKLFWREFARVVREHATAASTPNDPVQYTKPVAPNRLDLLLFDEHPDPGERLDIFHLRFHETPDPGVHQTGSSSIANQTRFRAGAASDPLALIAAEDEFRHFPFVADRQQAK